MIIYLYFNSIKVQLKLILSNGEGTLDLFQFHKGTIKTRDNHVVFFRPVISIP